MSRSRWDLQRVEDRPTKTAARGHGQHGLPVFTPKRSQQFYRVRHLPRVILESGMTAHQESLKIGLPAYQPQPATADNGTRVSASFYIFPEAVGVNKNHRRGVCALLP